MLHRIINAKDVTIYVWHITETAAELASLLSHHKELVLEGIDENLKLKLWHHTHFLSTRILLFNYAGLCSPILKDEYGKPSNSEKKISITHSNNYSAIIVSNQTHAAIDLEKIDDRILRVQHKFVHDAEKFFPEAQSVMYSTLIWSAKETLYKFYSANEVYFKEELRIHPFIFDDSRSFRGDILKAPATLDIDIQYFTFQDYVLTWCKQ
jgi:4'-phosphopantetheinyl transferase